MFSTHSTKKQKVSLDQMGAETMSLFSGWLPYLICWVLPIFYYIYNKKYGTALIVFFAPAILMLILFGMVAIVFRNKK
jgi:VIT1/CCC1 family predicted Fe2+/Mn2+ transporter